MKQQNLLNLKNKKEKGAECGAHVASVMLLCYSSVTTTRSPPNIHSFPSCHHSLNAPYIKQHPLVSDGDPAVGVTTKHCALTFNY